MEIEKLISSIETRSSKVAVIGLGYVGLTVACKIADSGFDVYGLERLEERVKMINAGIMPFEGNEPGFEELFKKVILSGKLTATASVEQLQKADIVLVAVETPVDPETRQPKYAALQSAITSLGKNLRPNTLVVIESTISPGTINKVVAPLLESHSGLKVDVDFMLGHCPERVMPGKLLDNITNMSRVCGGNTAHTRQAMIALYQTFVKGALSSSDSLTAEIVKTAENAFRDNQIAFANELALICENLGSDVWEVRDLMNKVPGRNMLYPGAGVGGHCIPKDPWLLFYANQGETYTPQLIPTSRHINDQMPHHMVDLLCRAFEIAKVDLKGSRIAVLGYAYLENSDDIRNSPTIPLVEELTKMGAEVIIHDPYVAKYQGDLHSVLKGSDAIVLMVKHDKYRKLHLDTIKAELRHPVIIDGRRVFDPVAVNEAGFIYEGVGWGRHAI